MVTSRTGTARWKNLRLAVLQEAMNNGIVSCPRCTVPLDYSSGKLPNSATVDHIVPYRHGGTDTRDNTQVLCRYCNTSLGAKNRRGAKAKTVASKTPRTARSW